MTLVGSVPGYLPVTNDESVHLQFPGIREIGNIA
jgi:hypothetical protein